MRVLLSSLPMILASFSANAHLGHLGDVAGHAHWVALGAGVTAAAIAALLAKKKLNSEKDANASEEDEVQDDCEPETTGA